MQGLRIDHIDGLAEPRAYLDRLREAVGADTYIVVEKILGAGEELPADWPVQGTTGYEFITALSGLSWRAMVYRSSMKPIADWRMAMAILKPGGKRLMVEPDFAGEAAASHAFTAGLFPELSKEEITGAICELLIAFSVYRTYGADGPLDTRDADLLKKAEMAAAGHLDYAQPLRASRPYSKARSTARRLANSASASSISPAPSWQRQWRIRSSIATTGCWR